VKKIVLEKKTSQGIHLQAVFLPEKGMNLISYQRDGVEVIAQSTWEIFEERYAGLGALIGPHFHRRLPALIPKIKNEELFPHIARVKAKGVQEPFSHGIARYAPWQAEASKEKVKATLSGADLWNGITLKELEGQNFKILFSANLEEDGLHLNLSVVSDTASLMGIHYYYDLPLCGATVTSQVKNEVRIEGKLQPIPDQWKFNEQQLLTFNLTEEADYTFRPYPDPLKAEILLETKEYSLRTSYFCNNEENCWQLYHPKDATFVCVEPISSQDPRHPNLTASQINIHLEILAPK